MTLQTPFIEKKPSSLRYFQEGPRPVDIGAWRLSVSGVSAEPFELSFDDLRALPAVDVHRRTFCVCLWTIKRLWRGVLLRTVLDAAGIDAKDSGLYLRQESIGTELGVYDTTIHLASALGRDALLAYEVDGQPLPLENGYPLRLIDFGLLQYKCVKALRRLEITREAELGHWEKQAGYDLDGTVPPKKYYAVDLQRKVWFGGTGESGGEDI